jgi:methylmalonyl-CoA mutase
MSEQWHLAADFPPATRERWRELVAAVLAKSEVEGDPEAALSSRTYDDITVLPLYTSDSVSGLPGTGAPGTAPFVRGATAAAAMASGWDVRQRVTGSDPSAVNAAILAELAHGTTSVWLPVGEGRLSVSSLQRALDGVYLDLAPIALDARGDTVAAAAALTSLAGHCGVDPAELHGTVGSPDFADIAALVALLREWPGLCIATVDGLRWSDAGAGDGDEIAIATAVGVAYLRALTDAGLSVDDALDRLEFRFAVTADQFASIAKLRAARRIWARVAELSGATPRRGQRQHAVTAPAMFTRRDPWVNMLRTTIACFAAAIGGADAITVLPFDAAIGQSDDFARRIARNTQSILHDESSLARVIDAAGGSWYVESLTDALANAAWQKFTAIERAGGALEASGLIDDLVATTRAKRDQDVAHRRAPITGVSEFAFLEEAPLTREPAPAEDEVRRWAGPYEALRDRADRAPQRPAVFLAALGPVAVHSARAGFAANLFAAGGICAVTGTGGTEEIVAAFVEAKTPLAVVCSSDKVYAESGAEVVQALREAGAQRVLLAGKAAVPGVDGAIFAGCDALAVLREAFDLLEVAP